MAQAPEPKPPRASQPADYEKVTRASVSGRARARRAFEKWNRRWEAWTDRLVGVAQNAQRRKGLDDVRVEVGADKTKRSFSLLNKQGLETWLQNEISSRSQAYMSLSL